MSDTTPQPLFRSSDPGPDEVAAHYVNHEWVQVMTAFRTRCILCRKDSPVIFCDARGANIAFGDPSLLRRGNVKYRDIAREMQIAFAEHGWKFQRKRSYCAECKGLKSV